MTAHALTTDPFDAPGAILLLSCYELGHAPLGVASPAGFLRAAGYAPAVHDLATHRLEEAAVRRARFVGISVPMHTALRLGQHVAERVRVLNPRAHLCFYGLYAGLNAELLLAGRADSVIGGEYEPALVALVQAIAAGSRAPVPGVSLPGRLAGPRLARTNFAPPAREGLGPLSGYARLVTAAGGRTGGQADERTVGYVEASRGCKHLCLHCPITPAYGGRFFAVPAANVLADIDRLVEQGAEHITFGDPDFFNGPGHARRIVSALHARHPGLSYDATIKVEHLLAQRALLPLLAQTGCAFVISAVESLSDTVLRNLDKGHTRADVDAALADMRAAGLTLRPTWVAFTPWTTLADYRALLAFIWREGLLHHVDSVQYAIRLLVPPGSALLGTPQFAPFERVLDAEALAHPWSHPDPAMDALQVRVAEIVEKAAADGSDAETTFRAVYAAAHEGEPHGGGTHEGEAHGGGTHGPALPPTHQPPAPRLTEPWFC